MGNLIYTVLGIYDIVGVKYSDVWRRKGVYMNDRERILMEIIDRLSVTQVLCRHAEKESDFVDRDGHIHVHFACYDANPIQKGDLVLAVTGEVSDFKIGWVHQVIDDSTCVIREIGGNRLCNYGNEKFERIIGMPPSLLLEGKEYIIYISTKSNSGFSMGE